MHKERQLKIDGQSLTGHARSSRSGRSSTRELGISQIDRPPAELGLGSLANSPGVPKAPAATVLAVVVAGRCRFDALAPFESPGVAPPPWAFTVAPLLGVDHLGSEPRRRWVFRPLSVASGVCQGSSLPVGFAARAEVVSGGCSAKPAHHCRPSTWAQL